MGNFQGHNNIKRHGESYSGTRSGGSRPKRGISLRIDRELNRVHFCYPYFEYDIHDGDKLVLGCPDEYITVTVTKIEHNRFGMKYYHFDKKEENE
jgi:hypothetical protein